MTESSDDRPIDVNEPLPFSDLKQGAILGYLIQNEQFFLQSWTKVKDTWFTDPEYAKLWKARVAYQRHWKQSPKSLEEFKGCQFLTTYANADKIHLFKKLDLAINATREFSLIALRGEMTLWLQSRIFKQWLEQASKNYNAAQFDPTKMTQAFSDIHSCDRQLYDATFDEVQEVKFNDLADGSFDAKRLLNKKRALTFGCRPIDEKILTGCENGNGLLRGDNTVILAPTNQGKCLGRGTPVLMSDGTIKSVESVSEGESVMGPDGHPRRVLSTTTGVGPLFRISPNVGGHPFVCNDVHVLTLKRTMGAGVGTVVDIPLRDYQDESGWWRTRHKLWRTGVDFAPRTLPIDPYVLGIWLGDGHSHVAALTSMDAPIADAWREWVENNGDSVVVRAKPGNRAVTLAAKRSPKSILAAWTDRARRNREAQAAHRRRKAAGEPRPPKTQPFTVRSTELLNKLGVLDNKHIPHHYLTSSREQRLRLLAGLLDTDGSLCGDGRGFEITQKSRVLADQIGYLARSLGFKVTETDAIKKDQNGTPGTYRRLLILGRASEIPTRLARKRGNDCKKDASTTGFRVEALGEGEFFGFTLDGDHRFLLGDFTVTHNSSCLITVARHNIFKKHSVLYITHEDHPDNIKDKLYRSMLLVSSEERMKMAGDAEGVKKLLATEKVLRHHFTYLPMNRPGLTVEEVYAAVQIANDKRKAETGQGYDLIIDDYPAKLTTDRASKGNLQKRHIDEIIYGSYFTGMALELDAHVMTAIQTNREGAKTNKHRGTGGRRLLSMEDVQESYGAMQTASNVISLNRDDQAEQNNRLTYHLCKTRSNNGNWSVVTKTRYDLCLLHGMDLDTVFYRGTATLDDRIDMLLEQHKGNSVPVQYYNL